MHIRRHIKLLVSITVQVFTESFILVLELQDKVSVVIKISLSVTAYGKRAVLKQ